MTYEEVLGDPDNPVTLIGQIVEVNCTVQEAVEYLDGDYEDLVKKYGSSAATALAIGVYLGDRASEENATHVDWHRVQTEDGATAYAKLYRGDGGAILADELVPPERPDGSLCLSTRVQDAALNASVEWVFVSWFEA